MLLPSVFGEDLFDETFPFAGMTDRHGHDKLFGNRAGRLMKTDVREGEKSWELDVELPGFRKENISATLLPFSRRAVPPAFWSALSLSATSRMCVRRERWSGALSHAFYVGEGVTEEDVKAKYENGVLSISIPKKEAIEAKAKKMIAIE